MQVSGTFVVFSFVIKEPVDTCVTLHSCVLSITVQEETLSVKQSSLTLGFPPHGTSAEMAFRAALSSISLAHLRISCTFSSVTFSLLSDPGVQSI